MRARTKHADAVLHILILPGLAADAKLIEDQMRKAHLRFHAKRVATKEAFASALRTFAPDIILADFAPPRLALLDALRLAKQSGLETLFFVVAGARSEAEEVAMTCIEQGADGYIPPSRLSHLAATIRRSFDDDAEKASEQTIAALRRRGNLYRLIAENTRDLICLLDRDGKCLYASRSFHELLGHAPAALVGTSFFAHAHPDDRENWQPLADSLSKRKGRTAEFRFKGRDGGWRVVQATVKAVPGHSDEAAAAIVIARDITDHKQAAAEAQETLRQLQRAMEGTIQAMALTLEMRDPYTAGHQRRVAELACAIARELGLAGDQIIGIQLAGSVHDIGKISVPAEILSKPGRLTEIEFNMIKIHPQVGYDILNQVDFPWPIATMALQHHERIDGSGYPAGLKGEETILEARILGVADIVEAMSSHRPYRPALGMDRALLEIANYSGVYYDSGVVAACLKVCGEKGFNFN